MTAPIRTSRQRRGTSSATPAAASSGGSHDSRPMANDRLIDPALLEDVFGAALRAGRLERLQRAMAAHGAEVCLFFNQANVRYATGVAAMTVPGGLASG